MLVDPIAFNPNPSLLIPFCTCLIFKRTILQKDKYTLPFAEIIQVLPTLRPNAVKPDDSPLKGKL